MLEAKCSGDRQPSIRSLHSPHLSLSGGWGTRGGLEVATDRGGRAVVPGVYWCLAAGSLRKLLESLGSTCTTTPHPQPAPACPIQMELVLLLTRLQRPWKRADKRSCAPTPLACEAGRGYSRIKWAAAGAVRDGAGRTLGVLQMDLWGEVKFLAPAAGDTVSPPRTQCRGKPGCRVGVTGGFSNFIPC